ncbi:MAG: cation transporter [Bdellovibrionales bacterium]|nr:cation transporter [Bdellovibrionales bacterium]
MSDNYHLDPAVKRATWLTVIVAISLFTIKYVAYHLTDSQAIFSEAMESIVNVFASIIAFFVILYSAKPADRDHPYGHGKVEYLSAALEGGLIAFAAVVIVSEAIHAFYEKRPLRSLDIGLVLLGSTGLVNYSLGFYLNYIGKKKHSPALEASGTHLMADFWTTVAVVGGLSLVWLTNIAWIDTLLAGLVGLHLIKEGYHLIKKSIDGLLDKEEDSIVNKIKELVNSHRMKGMLQVHHVRVMRSGKYHHIDAHLVVPEFWTVEDAHDKTNEYERMLFKEYPFSGEFHFHIDPCRKLYCQYCNLENCPVRLEPFKDFRDMSLSELTNTEEPDEVISQLDKDS